MLIHSGRMSDDTENIQFSLKTFDSLFVKSYKKGSLEVPKNSYT